MTKIEKAQLKEFDLISRMGRETFFESHIESAPAHELETYVTQKFSPDIVSAELGDERNIFHVMYWNNEPAGYSKIIPNCSNPLIQPNEVTKLERLYIKKEFYGKKLGLHLFQFNVELAKSKGQSGLWLNVWTGNTRAIEFYKKAGFSIIGDTTFRLSETRENPNYWMYLPVT